MSVKTFVSYFLLIFSVAYADLTNNSIAERVTQSNVAIIIIFSFLFFFLR